MTTLRDIFESLDALDDEMTIYAVGGAKAELADALVASEPGNGTLPASTRLGAHDLANDVVTRAKPQCLRALGLPATASCSVVSPWSTCWRYSSRRRWSTSGDPGATGVSTTIDEKHEAIGYYVLHDAYLPLA